MDFLEELFKTSDDLNFDLKIKRIEQEINDMEFERDEEKEEIMFNQLKVIVKNTLELSRQVQPEFLTGHQIELINLDKEITAKSKLLEISTQNLVQTQQNIQYESMKNAFKEQQTIDSYTNFARAINYGSKVQVEQFESLKSRFKSESIDQFRKKLKINSNEICLLDDQLEKHSTLEALEVFHETENELLLWTESILNFIEKILAESTSGYQLKITNESLKVDIFFPEIEFCAMDLLTSILNFIASRIQSVFPTQKNLMAKLISQDVWFQLQDLVIKYDLEPYLPLKLEDIEEFRSNLNIKCLKFEEIMKDIGIFSNKSKMQDYLLNSYKILSNTKVNNYILAARSIIFNETNKSRQVPELPTETPNKRLNGINSAENSPSTSNPPVQSFLTFPICEIHCQAKELSDLVLEISKELDTENIEM
jgi:hypothetical protein